MLQTIRNNSRGLGAKIFIGFIILVFALFGVESIVGTFINNTTVVSVNGEDIEEFQVENEAQRQVQRFIAQLGGAINASDIDSTQFREQAIQSLVEQTLLMQAARDAGMDISTRIIDRQIATTPDFQVDGVFSNERAQAMLRSAGYTPATYRALLEQELLLDQLVTAYSASSFATNDQLRRLAALTDQKRNLRYLHIQAASVAPGIELSEADIESYYEENQQQFMQPERVSVEYVELNRDELAGELEITEDEVRARYEQEIADSQAEVERRASHILLQASTEEDFAAAMEQAATIRERLDGGESFEDLAAEFSDDTGSAQAGGDVGWTAGDTFVAPFEQALTALEVGEVSEPVRTEFGVHLIRLTDRTDSDIPTFEESRDRLREELASERVEATYQARAQELGNLAFESVDLEYPAEALGLEVQTTDLFDRSGGAGIAANDAVVQAAFGPEVLEDGLNSEVIALSDSRSVVINLREHRQPELRPLTQVRGEVEAALKAQRAQEQVRQTGQSIANSLNNDQNIDSMLAANNLNWMQVENVERGNNQLPQGLVEQIFDMPQPAGGETVVEGFQLPNGDYAVVELREVIPGSLEELTENERSNLENFLYQQSAAEVFNAYVAGLRANADIERR